MTALKKNTPPKLSPKALAARASLMKAADTVLLRDGFHQLRIKDVTAEAGVATGLFYRYFKDFHALVDELIDELLERFEATEEIEKNVSKGDWFNRLKSHYEFAVRTYAEQPGLMRCITQFCSDDPGFRARWKEASFGQMNLLISVFPHVFPDHHLSVSETELMVYALGGIGQELMYEYYVVRNPDIRQLELTEEEMAEWLAALFYRGLFASNPSPKLLKHASKILSIKR